MFKNKVLLITGGTGSFGNAVLRKEIRIFSRDDMRKKYNNDKLKFYLGDVNSLDDAIRGVDYIFHAAALKQVSFILCKLFKQT